MENHNDYELVISTIFRKIYYNKTTDKYIVTPTDEEYLLALLILILCASGYAIVMFLCDYYNIIKAETFNNTFYYIMMFVCACPGLIYVTILIIYSIRMIFDLIWKMIKYD
jgi:hypothetical protein